MIPLREQKLLYGFVGAFAVVALAFLLASTIAALSSRAVDLAAADMLSNALPSVDALMSARSALRRLESNVDALAVERPTRPERFDAVSQAHADLDQAVVAAAATPWYPGEYEVYQKEVLPRLREVERSIGNLETEVPSNGEPEIRPELARFDTAANGLDSALAAMAEVNHSGGYASAWRIVGTRAHIVRTTLALDLASTVLAFVAAAVAVNAARRFARVARRTVELETERAEELDKFAQRVAHDLISPMAAVTLSLGRIQRAHPDPETTRTAERAQRALDGARQMVDSIYRFAGSGARPTPGAKAPLRATVHDAVRDQLAAEGGCGAPPPVIEVEPFDEVEVAIERAVLGVVLTNLLSNASKFTRDAVERRISVRAQANHRRARVEVEDTGPGVPAGFEQAIFEPYRRGPGVEKPGIGLGLATVRRLVQAYGGAVGVGRASPTGAIFWFELPLATGAGERATRGEGSPPQPSQEGARGELPPGRPGPGKGAHAV
jgi:signal transduction histidine kinase